METTGKWILGGLIGILALVGLIASANAADQAFYYGGLGVFVVSVLVIFVMIDNAYDDMEKNRHSH